MACACTALRVRLGQYLTCECLLVFICEMGFVGFPPNTCCVDYMS